jgi:hypothetical protein
MKAVIIENPILNSPFESPRRHFKFNDDGITDEIVESRRPSSYFVPIASPKKKGKQLTFDTLWTLDRAKENDDINFIRSRIALWRCYKEAASPLSANGEESWSQTAESFSFHQPFTISETFGRPLSSGSKRWAAKSYSRTSMTSPSNLPTTPMSPA